MTVREYQRGMKYGGLLIIKDCTGRELYEGIVWDVPELFLDREIRESNRILASSVSRRNGAHVLKI